MRFSTRSIILLLLLHLGAGRGVCAERIVEPSLAAGEEYVDNLYLDPVNEVHEYITHIIPAIRGTYATPLWKWSLDYSYDYRHYGRDTVDDDADQNLKLQGAIAIVKQTLFLGLRDDYGRISTTPVHDYTRESLIRNLTEYNAFETNPYASLQLATNMTMTLGYRYRNVWYKDPAAVDRTVQGVAADIVRDLSDRTHLTASFDQERTVTAPNTIKRTTLLFGARYEYRADSFLWGKAGDTATVVGGDRTETRLVWDAGLEHHLTNATVHFETGRTWIEDPLAVERREDRYLASLRVGAERRTQMGVALAVREYGDDRFTDERKYSSSVDFSHLLSQRVQGRYAFAIDRYEQYPAGAPDTMTIVYLTDVRFDYHAGEHFTLSMQYRYADSYSSTRYPDNYTVNRVLIEARTSF